MASHIRRWLAVVGWCLSAAYAENGAVQAQTNPVTSNGTLYFEGIDRCVHAIDAKNGLLKWKYEPTSAMVVRVAADRDRVYIGAAHPVRAKKLIALDAASGKHQWEIDLDMMPTEALPVGNLLYFGCGGSSVGQATAALVCVEAKTGREQWRFESKACSLQHLSLGGGLAFVAGPPNLFGAGDLSKPDVGSDTLIAVDLKTQKQIWTFGEFQDFPTFLHCDKDRVFLGTIDVRPGAVGGRLHAIDARTGKEQWSFDVQDGPNAFVPALAAEKVVFASGKTVFALDRTTGERQWVYETKDKITSSISISDGKAFFGIGEELAAIDMMTGKEIWRFASHGSIHWAPASVEGALYFGGGKTLHAVDASGKENWKYETGDAPPAEAPGRG